MDAYVCDECGYYYDPVYGDEHNGIKEGTPFSRLPNGWVCPECGAPKKKFSRLEDDDELQGAQDYDEDEVEDEDGWEDDEDDE